MISLDTFTLRSLYSAAMQTRTRTLRGRIADTTGIRPILSPREIDRRNTILRAATTLLADFPSNSFTLSQFALAIEASPSTIKRYFIDMDGMLTEILLRHMRALAAAIGQIPPGAADEPAARRAAYLAHTRTPLGGLTQEHLLFTRDRFGLPPEDLARLDTIHTSLGESLGGLSPQDVLALLDSPALEPAEIETLLAARLARAAERIRLAHTKPAPQPEPAAKPAQPPPPLLRPAPPPNGKADNWMPSPSLYERHQAAMRARAGPH